MDQKIIFLTLLGMALVTFLPRLLPIWLLATRKLPEVAVTWLRYVPAAVLAALLFPSVLTENAHLSLSWNNLYLLAFVPTVFVAWRTRSMFAAVITGMLLVAVGRLVMHV